MTRPNIFTEFEGRELAWRIGEDEDGFDVELLTPIKLAYADYRRAEEEAVEAFAS